MDFLCNAYSNSSDEDSDLKPNPLLISDLKTLADSQKMTEILNGDGFRSQSRSGSKNDRRTLRLTKFTGTNFRTWQQKMLLYLTMLDLSKFVKDDPPIVREDEVDTATTFNDISEWKHSDYLCRNYILNGLTDTLYDVYSVKETAKELWESLDRIYNAKNVVANRYLVSRLLRYNMVDSKKVVSQVQELQLIIHEIVAGGMALTESFQVASIIVKLPPGWEDFKDYLMRKRKEMTVDDLIVRVRIEEDNRDLEKRISNAASQNVVEGNEDSARGNPTQTRSKLGPKGGISKKLKFSGKCYNCNKPGHKSSDCRLPRRVKGNAMEGIMQNMSGLANSNAREWWLATGATRHVCCDEDVFVDLVPCTNGEKLHMGNAATSEIKGKGTVMLKMASSKQLKLQNVLYVPDIRKNLVSGYQLNAHGFTMNFESDKFFLSKSGIYVGKGYVSNGMWKFNLL